MKKNWLTYVILAATVILAAIAIFTAYKLYQIGREPVAPTAPAPAPAVGPTTNPACYQVCGTEEDCKVGDLDLGYECGFDWCPPGQNCITINKCYNPECPTEPTCICSAVVEPTPDPACTLEFEIEGPTATPTPTPIPDCWDICETDFDCPDSLVCLEADAADRCVNPDCPGESDCECPGVTPTPTLTPTPTTTPPEKPTATPTTIVVGATPTPTPVAELPEAGLSLPTAGLALGGLLLILFSLLLAF